jgi:hypothetical protein
MPAAAPVEELLATRAQRRDDVLEIRRRGCNRTQSRGIKQAPPPGEERDRGDPAPDFEATAGNVLVRNAVCDQVQDWSE